MTEEDRLRDKLRKELRAYAVEYRVGNYLSDLRNVAQRTTPISHEVERIRREVNVLLILRMLLQCMMIWCIV